MNRQTCTQTGIQLNIYNFTVILSWFVDKQVTTDLEGQLIDEDRVKCRPEQIPDSVVHKNSGI